jgi:hypothetical protein
MELKFKGGEQQRKRLSLSLSLSFHSHHTIYSSAVTVSLNGEPDRILRQNVALFHAVTHLKIVERNV